MHNSSISYLSLRSSPHLFLSHTPPLLPGLPSIQRYHLPSLDVAPPPFPSHPCRSSDARCGAVGVAAREHLRPGVELRQHGAARTATWGYGSGMRQRRAPKQHAQWCRATRAVACRAATQDPSPMGAQGRGSSTHAVWDRAQGSHFLFDLWTGRRGVTRP